MNKLLDTAFIPSELDIAITMVKPFKILSVISIKL